MVTRIVLADQSEARFYEVEHLSEPLRLIGRLTDPNAHLHDRELKSDRPGRVFDRAAPSGSRRGAVSRHSTGSERTPRKHAAQLFARRIAHELEAARRESRFARLVLVAGPPFLGVLRSALPKAVTSAVIGEIPKDLVHEPESSVRTQLTHLSL